MKKPKRTSILHFDTTGDTETFWVQFPDTVPEDRTRSGGQFRVDTTEPLYAMLFTEEADPEAIAAGDFENHRILATGWPKGGRQCQMFILLKDSVVHEEMEGLASNSYSAISMHAPKVFPDHKYVALRRGKRCVYLIRSNVPNNYDLDVSLDRDDLAAVFKGIKPGMDVLWLIQQEPGYRFNINELKAFYEADNRESISEGS